MTPRVGHDADVAAPDDQISGLRRTNAKEARVTKVEIARTGVLIRETGLFIKLMNKMRAIRFRRSLKIRRGDGPHDPATLRLVQQLDMRRILACYWCLCDRKRAGHEA